MKKILTTLILTASVCLSLISCTGITSNNNSTTSTNNGETGSTISEDLTISAAASLKEAMADIEPLFNQKYPNIHLTFNFGASGSLQQQIEQGAPCDIFISAGQSQMTSLIDKSLILDDSKKNLVQNSLVLVSTKDSTITSLDDIKSDKVKTIAVGEPSSVPAGKYADEVFTKLRVKDSISSKLVFAKDVKEVLAWSSSGNSDVGFVYLSDAISNDSVKIIETISEDLHSPITYPIGIIKSTKYNDASKEFEEFLFTYDAQKIFEKYGYKKIS